MSYKRFGLVTIVLTLLLVSCQRSADPYPVPTSAFNAPLDPSVDPMKMIEEFATATALAKTAPGLEAEETPTPVIEPPIEQPTEAILPTSTEDVFATLPPLPTLPSISTPIATPQTTIPTETTSVVRPATYTLQRGEFPYCLARRFDVDPNELLALNGITRAQAYSLMAGTVLKIPQSGSFPGERALRPHPTTYTVVSPNETLYGIACLFGDVDPLQIAQANGITLETPLSVGQVLNIP